MTDGERIKEMRIRRGMTLAEVGKRLGISRQAMWNMENRDNIGMAVLRQVAKVLDTHEAYLCGLLSEEQALDLRDAERIADAYRKASPETKAIIRKILEV